VTIVFINRARRHARSALLTKGRHPMRNLVFCLALACIPAAVLIAPSVHAADTPTVSPQSAEAKDLEPVRAEIKAKQYNVALAQLKVLVVKYPDADTYTLLGHALWKTGDRQQGMAYYNKALALNPLHRGALEYQGELYVALGQVDKAKENLAKLKGVCPFGCEEASDLGEAIEHAPKGG
jgi:tetratricopeptide (TPR) repeat protein